jgi:hypothetical protein
MFTDFDEHYLSIFLLAAGDGDTYNLPLKLKAIDVFKIISSFVLI